MIKKKNKKKTFIYCKFDYNTKIYKKSDFERLMFTMLEFTDGNVGGL